MIDGTSATGTTSTGDRVAVILTRDPDESATTTLTTTTVPAAGTVINGSSTSTSVTTAPAVINGSSTTTSLTTTTAPAVINGSSTTNGTTTSSTTNGTAPAAGGAKRTLFDVLGTPGALMTRPEKDRLLKAKAKKNTTKAVPVAVVEEMLDFACAVYPRLQSGTKFDALPKKVLLPPRVTKTTVLAGVMPNPRQYETAGMTLIIVDWSALGIDLHYPICGTTLRNSPKKNTIFRNDAIGIKAIITGGKRPCYSSSALSECPCCKEKSGNPKVFRHDNEAVLRSLDPDDQTLYPCDPHQCSDGRFRASRDLVSQLVESVMSSDMGFSTYLRTISVGHAEERTRTHLSYTAAVKKVMFHLNAEVGDDVWGKKLACQKVPLMKARNLLISIRANQLAGRRGFQKYDDSIEVFGSAPLDDSTVKGWIQAELESRKDYRIREQQSVDVPSNYAAAIDGCPRLGKAAQIHGAPPGRQLVMITAAYHQIVMPLLVEKGTYRLRSDSPFGVTSGAQMTSQPATKNEQVKKMKSDPSAEMRPR